MDKLNRKLKAKKAMITKSLKRLETATESFQEVGQEDATMTLTDKNLIKMEAEELLESVDKIKENRKGLESLSSSLQEAINDCEPSQLKGLTQEEAINKVENGVEEYIDRINVMLKSKKRIIAYAKTKSVIDISGTVAPAVPSVQHY